MMKNNSYDDLIQRVDRGLKTNVLKEDTNDSEWDIILDALEFQQKYLRYELEYQIGTMVASSGCIVPAKEYKIAIIKNINITSVAYIIGALPDPNIANISFFDTNTPEEDGAIISFIRVYGNTTFQGTGEIIVPSSAKSMLVCIKKTKDLEVYVERSKVVQCTLEQIETMEERLEIIENIGLTSDFVEEMKGMHKKSIDTVYYCNDINKINLKSGNFIVNQLEQKQVSNLRLNSNLYLSGNQISKLVIKDNALQDECIFNVKDKENVVIDGIIFDGNKENVHGTIYSHVVMLYLTNCRYVTIRNCRFVNSYGGGIQMNGCSHVTIKNCHFTQIDTCINSNHDGNNKNVTIDQCYFDGESYKYSEPISLIYGDELKIINCTFKNKQDTMAIYLDHYKNVTISSCTIEKCGEGMRISESENVRISNCNISYIRNTAMVLNGKHIMVEGIYSNYVNRHLLFQKKFPNKEQTKTYMKNEDIFVRDCIFLNFSYYTAWLQSILVLQGGNIRFEHNYFDQDEGTLVESSNYNGYIYLEDCKLNLVVKDNTFYRRVEHLVIVVASDTLSKKSKVLLENNTGHQNSWYFNPKNTEGIRKCLTIIKYQEQIILE